MCPRHAWRHLRLAHRQAVPRPGGSGELHRQSPPRVTPPRGDSLTSVRSFGRWPAFPLPMRRAERPVECEDLAKRTPFDSPVSVTGSCPSRVREGPPGVPVRYPGDLYMRHRASRPLVDFWHRLPRTAAGLVGKAASDRPVRALAALMVALGVATGGYVIVASSVGESNPQAQPVDATASDEAIHQHPTGETLAGSAGPTTPSSSPDPDTSAAGKPPPSRSTTATPAPIPLPRPLAGQVTGLPDSTTATPSTSPSQQSPTPSTSPERLHAAADQPVRRISCGRRCAVHVQRDRACVLHMQRRRGGLHLMPVSDALLKRRPGMAHIRGAGHRRCREHGPEPGGNPLACQRVARPDQ